VSEQQQYSNHVRFHPPFHFVLIPLLLLHLLYTAYQLFRNPDLPHVDSLLLAIALMVMAFLVRINPLRVQDRLIRLEEAVRYGRVLPRPLAERAVNELRPGQIVALRFASDHELPQLIERVLSGQLTNSAEIKKAIGTWRGDYLRV